MVVNYNYLNSHHAISPDAGYSVPVMPLRSSDTGPLDNATAYKTLPHCRYCWTYPLPFADVRWMTRCLVDRIADVLLFYHLTTPDDPSALLAVTNHISLAAAYLG